MNTLWSDYTDAELRRVEAHWLRRQANGKTVAVVDEAAAMLASVQAALAARIAAQYDAAGAILNARLAELDAAYAAYESANDDGRDNEADTLLERISELQSEVEHAGNVVAMWSERLDGVTP